MPVFELESLGNADRSRLITRCVAPRPIAFVSSLDASGVGNLAPFSFFNAGGQVPPSCVFSATRDRHGSGKHTLANIEATGEYVINVVTYAMAGQVNRASFEYPPEIDEFDVAGFTREPSLRVKPPRVAESPIALECRLHKVIPHGDGPGASNYIIGEILVIRAKEDVCVDGMIDERLVGLAARAGGDRWVRIDAENFFPLARPTSP